MAENPIFSDPGAYRSATPGAPRVADQSPIGDAVGRLGATLGNLGTLIYKQEQADSVLNAQLRIARGFQAIQQEASQEQDFNKIKGIFEKGAFELQNEAMALSKDDRTGVAIDAHFQRASMMTEANITQVMLAKKADATGAKITELYSQLKQEVALSPTIDIEKIKEQSDELADYGLAAGTMSKAGREAFVTTSRQELEFINASYAVQRNATSALDLLQERDGEDGPYSNFTDLDPLKRLSLIHDATVGMRQKTENLTRAMNAGVDNTWTGKSAPSPEELAARGADPAAVDVYAARQRAATAGHSAMVRFATGNPEEQRAALAEMDASQASGQPDNEYYLEANNRLGQEVVAIQKQWDLDPGAAVDRWFPIKVPGGKDATLAQRMEHRATAYASTGRQETRLLSAAEAGGLTASVMNVNPDLRGEAAKKVMAQIAPFPQRGIAQLISKGSAGGGDMPIEFLDLPTAGYALSAELGVTMGKDLASIKNDRYVEPADATDAERAAKRLFQEGVGMGFPQGDAESASLYGARQETFTKLALQMRDPAGAYELMFGKYKMRGTDSGDLQIRMPPGMTPDQQNRVVAAANDMFSRVPTLGVIVGNAPASESAEILRGRPASTGMVTYSDEKGEDAGIVLVSDGRPVVTRDGSPLAMTFAEAMRFEPKPTLVGAGVMTQDTYEVLGGQAGMAVESVQKNLEKTINLQLAPYRMAASELDRILAPLLLPVAKAIVKNRKEANKAFEDVMTAPGGR